MKTPLIASVALGLCAVCPSGLFGEVQPVGHFLHLSEGRYIKTIHSGVGARNQESELMLNVDYIIAVRAPEGDETRVEIEVQRDGADATYTLRCPGENSRAQLMTLIAQALAAAADE